MWLEQVVRGLLDENRGAVRSYSFVYETIESLGVELDDPSRVLAIHIMLHGLASS